MKEEILYNNKAQLLVIGSYNLDLISNSEKLPRPGETVLGDCFFTSHGGKGANQAVAAAKLGQKTIFLAKVGNDVFGEEAIHYLHKEGINTEYIKKKEHTPTGTAQIIVDSKGENMIVVSPGANGHLTTEDIETNEVLFRESTVVLVQFEIPMDTLKKVITLTKKYNKTLIVNPAPAHRLDREYLSQIDYLTPNESELKMISNMHDIDTLEDVITAGKKVLNDGIKHLIVTLGEKGILYLTSDSEYFLQPYKVNVVDSTGAGDCFNGAFAHFLINELPIVKALQYASATAALSVTKQGSSTSFPSTKEVNDFLSSNQIR